MQIEFASLFATTPRSRSLMSIKIPNGNPAQRHFQRVERRDGNVAEIQNPLLDLAWVMSGGASS